MTLPQPSNPTFRSSGAVSYEHASDGERSGRTAARLGWAATVIGGLVLVGWIMDWPLLKSGLPGQVEAKSNTAVSLLLAGLALVWKTASGIARPVRLRLASMCATFAAGVGLLTVVEYAFGVDLGIDQLFFHEASGAAFTVHAGRMALPTACNFVLVGWALLWLRPGRDSRTAVLLSAPVAVLARVRRIVARRGGRTWAEGRLDAGATFYFILRPASAVPAAPIPAQS